MKQLIFCLLLPVLTITFLWSVHLNRLEYFVDTDPGSGIATPLVFSMPEPNSYVLDFDAAGGDITPGMHIIGVRLQNSAGYWSMATQRFFYITGAASSPLQGFQWYFTGEGANPEGVYYQEISELAMDINTTVFASVAHLPEDGDYEIHLNAINALGQHSMDVVIPISVNFTPQNISIQASGNTVTLSWDEIAGANSYTVMQRNAPDAEPPVISQVTGNSLSLPAAEAGFFNVRAYKDTGRAGRR